MHPTPPKAWTLLALLLGVTLAASAADFDPPAPIAPGPFKPTWQSLAGGYHTPDWFRDAKFGIWAHWGAQCEPEHGDWYARKMYIPGEADYASHLKEYGHPSQSGFKDIIRIWRAEHFDPDHLLAFYKENGARYFMALANHHDNFDNWNSTYQPWNSVALGPRKDLIGMWAAAARRLRLRFGVSVHASHAWSWYEPAQGSDPSGPLAGVPYDGTLTAAQGKGQWWDGLDPQDLYSQNHRPGKKLVWDWNRAEGSSVPDRAYIERFYLRTKQLWDDYRPDLIYFDDTGVPFSGITDQVGLDLAAHFYNSSIRLHGRNEAVMTGKKLSPLQTRAITYDIERGKAASILPLPWQTDTCIGDWHYDKAVYRRHGYKTAAMVIPMLADIVSKNGNLMLNIPLQADGTPDPDELAVVRQIGAWLRRNGEAIYATRPWTVYGEGPSTRQADKGRFGGQKDTSATPFTAEDIRFTRSKDGKTLYAIVLAVPATGSVLIKSLAGRPAASVELLGSGPVSFESAADGLRVDLPKPQGAGIALALRINGLGA